MNEMLLFGAGASKEAGVPTALGLTNKIANEFHTRPELHGYASDRVEIIPCYAGEGLRDAFSQMSLGGIIDE